MASASRHPTMGEPLAALVQPTLALLALEDHQLDTAVAGAIGVGHVGQ